ncbi:SEL1-like repeat protein [Vibrio inusitatus]|uniref:SEL1-like repeat protein n=1 Tax=Vibrio inusitatus TaxID=413402 RepID=UPI003081D275
MIAVWTGIGTNQIVSDIALFKVGLALDGRPSSIVHEIVDSMTIARSVPTPHKLTTLRLDWLISLQSKAYAELAQQALEDNSNIGMYLQKLRLPKANNYTEEVYLELTNCINAQNITDFEDGWLFDNFQAISTTLTRIKVCQSIILEFENYKFGDLCSEIVEKHCLPTQPNSYWGRLSHQAREVLKKKYDLTSYYDLQAISSALYSQRAADELGFTEDEVRQISNRSKFWSNYSSKFNRVRVLLPQGSHDFVHKYNGGLPDFVDVLERSSENIEVYIFELDKLMVVELLRGNVAETRIFKPDRRLFENGSLSIDTIRSLPQLEVHDHLELWQYFCERLLRINYQIHPNIGTTRFKGLGREMGTYTQDVGLPLPSSEMMSQRKLSLEAWLQKFWEAEIATGKFGKHQDLTSKGSVYLSQAMLAKHLGQVDQFRTLIRQSAEQGNSEAMYRLGQSMLRNHRSDREAKQEAESWIVKAAENGHKEAENFAYKFRLNVKKNPELPSADEGNHVAVGVNSLSQNSLDKLNKRVSIDSSRVNFLTGRAESGSADAMYELGHYLLTNVGNSLSSRLVAEKWISKAASLGHLDAVVLAKKFRIKF